MKRAKKRKGSNPQMPPSKISSTSSVELGPSCTRQDVESHDLNSQKSVSAWDKSEEGTSTSGRRFLVDSRSVELKLVQALKRKEVDWQAWPKSFLASEGAHSRY